MSGESERGGPAGGTGGETRAPLAGFLKEVRPRIEGWLERFLPGEGVPPGELHRAMRYSVFSGGKRLRPALAVFSAELFDPDPEAAAAPAAALEFVHTYSLIHDDLPCMDDDDLRRGRPTSHKVFGEALAVLAGDALLTRGFEVLCETPRAGVIGELLAELGRAAGSLGMVGGQVLDLENSGTHAGQELSQEALLERVATLHRKKTAALIAAAVVMGALAGGANREAVAALRTFGECAGLAFQIADDILDVVGTAEVLGKTPGKDAAAGKATYALVLGVDEARSHARAWVARSLEALHSLQLEPGALVRLEALAHFAIERSC